MHSLINFFFPPNQPKSESIPAFLIFLGSALFVLFLGVIKVFMTVGGIVVCIGLVAQFALRGPKSFLLASVPSLAFLLAMIFMWFGMRSIWAMDPSSALPAFKTSIYKGLVFFIAGMEIMRRPRYLKVFLYIFLAPAIFHGINGVWQYVTGFDLINGDPILGTRLTSSFSNYRVGNLIAMLLVPLFALPYFMPDTWSKTKKATVTFLLLASPFFLLIFAQARSGYLCVAASFFALFLLRKGLLWKYVGVIIGLAVLTLFFGPDRVGIGQVLHDARIKELWPFAIEVFKQSPVIGVGVNSFNPAFTALGLTPTMTLPNIPHPHNIYLQLLSETGLVGLVLYTALLLTVIIWGWKTLRPLLANGFRSEYLGLTSAFWAACVGYACMAVSAHDLFRTWWFGLAMLFLGLVAGFCAIARAQK